MYRLSLIIGEVYNKYLSLAEKNSISLNLDFSDTTKTISDPEIIKTDLDQHLKSALDRSDRGEIKITVESDAIVVTDSGTILSKPICALLSNNRVNVSSRVGFGTTVRISLLPQTEIPTKAQTEIQAKAQTETQTKALAETKQNTPASPTRSLPDQPSAKTIKSTKTAELSRAKLLRDQRRLAAAAEKADRQIRRIQKTRKTKLQNAAQTKTTTPTTKTPTTKITANAKTKSKTSTKAPAKPRKTRKRIIEFS